MLVYRIAITVLAPVLILVLLWRLSRGYLRVSDLLEQLGGNDGCQEALWVHGASNGELISGKAVIIALRKRFPMTPIVVTSNSISGRQLVDGWALECVAARLAPFDYRWPLARFRKNWQPIALISLENEMWPNRIGTAPHPVICIAARISERSAARWARLLGLMPVMLRKVAYLAPQDAESGARFVSLGLDETALGMVVSLKSEVTLATADMSVVDPLKHIFQREQTLLAASTHAGEEEIILDGFSAAKTANQSLKLILAPRHPKRAGQIQSLILARDLSVARRSHLQEVTPETDVYLVDTLGEMHNWYALAGMTFVGGSLVAKGGHTPFEPARAGTAILHGPYFENFALAYSVLSDSRAAKLVESADDLTSVLRTMTGEQQRDLAQAAQANLARFDQAPGLLDDLIAKIESLVS